MATAAGEGLYVRRATGLVRDASLFDAIVYNAAVSAPVGALLAWSVFFILSLFPGADIVLACGICFVLNIPILIMMALMSSAIPKTGGDYIWVSRILNAPTATVSHVSAAICGLAGADYFARYFAVYALGPLASALGIVFNAHWLLTWGSRLQTDKPWIFIAGTVLILGAGAIMLMGTKTTFRWQNVFWITASAGTFLAFIVFLIGSHSDFVHHYNSLSHHYGAHGNVYAATIAKAQGIDHHPHPGKLSSTIPAVFLIMAFSMFNWWSIYTNGELRSAASRNRQLSVMFGALVWDLVFLAIGALLIYKVAGYAFMSAVNAGSPAYVIPTAPWYHFIASLVYDNHVLTLLIVGSFAFWALPAMLPNMFVPIRSLFAWSFDRLIPERFSRVSERRGAPTVAILFIVAILVPLLLWTTYDANLQALVGFSVLAGALVVVLVAVAAFVFPSRRPDLYQSSPANVDLFGIPLLKIVSPLAILVMAFLVWATLKYPPVAIGTPAHRWWVPGYLGGIVMLGLVMYYGARFVRRREGVDIDNVFMELPPD
jgi:APA family basic amino acid/polyamine antiporter